MNVASIDDQNIIVRFVGGRFAGGNLAFEAALDGVVLEQVGQIVGRHNIADGDDIHFPADHSLLGDGAEDQAADAAKSIDCNFEWHISSFFLLVMMNYRELSNQGLHGSGAPVAVNEKRSGK
jgi:hypothetical protein